MGKLIVLAREHRDAIIVLMTESIENELDLPDTRRAEALRTIRGGEEVPEDQWDTMAADRDPYVRAAVASRHDCPERSLRQLINDPVAGVVVCAAGNPSTPPDALNSAISSKDPNIRLAACSHPELPMDLVREHYPILGKAERLAIFRNPKVSEDIRAKIAEDIPGYLKTFRVNSES